MKKLTIIGLCLIIFALGVLYLSSLTFESNIANNTIQVATIAPNSIIVEPVQITNTTIFGFFYYTQQGPINYYLVNQTVYNSISNYTNSSGKNLFNATKNFEGNGVYEILINAQSGLFPYQNVTPLSAPNYFYNGTSIFNTGTYYSIFQNTQGSNNTVYFSVIKKLQVSVNNSLLSTTVFGLVGAVLFILGIIFIGYSMFIIKEKPTVIQTSNPTVDKLYAEYSTKPAAKKAKKSSKKTKKNR